MTDRQAAEAREAIAQALLGVSYAQALAEWEGGELAGTVSGEAFGHLVALSVRLAQAEQERDEAQGTAEVLSGHLAATAAKLHVAEVRLREYEEALDAIARNAEGWHSGEDGKAGALNVIATWARDPGSIPAGVLAASGGREAPKEERLDE